MTNQEEKLKMHLAKINLSESFEALINLDQVIEKGKASTEDLVSLLLSAADANVKIDNLKLELTALIELTLIVRKNG